MEAHPSRCSGRVFTLLFLSSVTSSHQIFSAVQNPTESPLSPARSKPRHLSLVLLKHLLAPVLPSLTPSSWLLSVLHPLGWWCFSILIGIDLSLSMNLLIGVPIFRAKIMPIKYCLLSLVWISLELSVLMRNVKQCIQSWKCLFFSTLFTRRLEIFYYNLFYQIFLKYSTVFIETNICHVSCWLI